MDGARNEPILAAMPEIPASLRDKTTRWVDRWRELHGVQDAGEFDPLILLRLVASSDYAAGVLMREWPWFLRQSTSGRLALPLDRQSLSTSVDKLLSVDADLDDTKTKLRNIRHRQMLRILWRAIANRDDAGSIDEALMTLSILADVLIAAATEIAERSLLTRFGLPRTNDGRRIPLITLAMGKLGGNELNFSSDVDLIFLYPHDGETDGERRLSAHEYFTRLTRQVTSLLDDVTADGFVYRVDTRLRPFGDSGPVVVSFAALETYLTQHGRGWERYAYVKSRAIAPPNAAEQVSDLMRNMIEPFVYRRYLDYGVFESLRDMQSMIVAEVKKKELANNIKLGPGGIREIEFIAQSLQLVRGGNDESLRCPELLSVLPRLAGSKGLSAATTRSLASAYRFLRRLENAIQAMRDQQDHDLPQSAEDRARLTLAMNYGSWRDLVRDLQSHQQVISETFAEIAFRSDSSGSHSELRTRLTRYWESNADENAWATALEESGFTESVKMASTVTRFAGEVIGKNVDAVARKRLASFVATLLVLLRERSTPQVTCQRVFNIAAGITRRSAYISLLNENPATMRRLVTLCEQSAFLAHEIARFPLLLDELLDPRLYAREITAAEMRNELMERLRGTDVANAEVRVELLGQFQRAMLFRIAVADFSGNLPIMKVSDRLTELAEIVLGEALEIAWTDLTRKHGLPQKTAEQGRESAGLAVIAYGKLGGMELSYQSDLDLVFVHDSMAEGNETDGEKPLDNSMFFARLVRRLVHFLSAQTGSGALYEIDTRLRPSGRSGLLVVNVAGFDKYQEQDAWTWEHQALLRSRPVAGSQKVAREYERIRTRTLCSRIDRRKLAREVSSMRTKMRKQLDQSSETGFDLKQGKGGITDIEFLVQFLILKNAAINPALIHYTDNIRQLGAIGACGILDANEVRSLQSAYRQFRHSLHRLSLNNERSLVDDGLFVPERELVATLWQREINQVADAETD